MTQSANAGYTRAMPLYDYACPQCRRVFEIRHGFDESYGQPCENCGAALRRVFNPAPVVFKGSGFYVTDSRRATSSAKAEKPKDDSTPTSATAKSDATPSKESKDTPKSSDSAA